jgi:hypothetical protein
MLDGYTVVSDAHKCPWSDVSDYSADDGAVTLTVRTVLGQRRVATPSRPARVKFAS